MEEIDIRSIDRLKDKFERLQKGQISAFTFYVDCKNIYEYMSDFNLDWLEKISDSSFRVYDYMEAAETINEGKLEGRYKEGYEKALSEFKTLLEEMKINLG